MTDISIVSGTYNRLNYLQAMVESVRNSFTDVYGLTYEIILVDGNSYDGTIKWCEKQSDIRLIRHTKLLGAVRAFNDGAYAASGKYVIMANDDIEFLDDSIFIAYLYMQQNPDCGVGCFFQDRNGRDWHVDHMPVVLGGKQGNLPYGQVCIVPRWLGDRVGWWGDYQHTYGGDNELSARIYDLGLKISPVHGAKIHDREAIDGLRKRNNIDGAHDPKAVKGHHPDSWAWGRKWRDVRTGLVGPVVKDKSMIEYEGKVELKERVLYLPIFEQGWQVQKEQKRGLRDALAKVALVREYDYFSAHAKLGKRRMMEEIFHYCRQLKPTIVLTQLHNSELINSGDLHNMRKHCGGEVKFANWNGDYWPDQLLDNHAIELAKALDLNTVVNRDVVEKHQKLGLNTRYWQIGWEPDGTGCESNVSHDIVFLASGYSEKRQKLGQWLKDYCRKNQYSLGIYGSGWPEGLSKGQTLYDFKASCRIYRGAKIAIGDSQWPESGFVSNRIFQILAAGNCVLCHQWFRGIEQLGLYDSENCFIWKDLSDLERVLDSYLPKDDKLKILATSGHQLALTQHSFDSRVAELWQMLEIGQKESVGGWRW